jgi:transcriptional regulator with XRE-family HTH domain
MNHGTHSGYTVHRQRGEAACDACLVANREYHRRRRVIKGLNKNVDPEPARQHIIRLLANGATLRGIAAEAGMNVRQVGEVYRGCHASIWPETEARILAVERGWSLYIPAAGTARRIDALRRMGWTVEHLADRLGVTFQAVHYMTRQKRVRRDTAERVAAIYDELSMVPGPSAILRARAATQGLLPPLAWDDDTIDDPAAWASPGEDTDDLPDDVVVERLLRGMAHWRDATMADRREAARRAFDGAVDGPYTFCERRLGLNTEAIRSVVEAVAA